MKSVEAPEEAPTVSQERLLQLSCFISQGSFSSDSNAVGQHFSSDVKYLLTGLKNVR